MALRGREDTFACRFADRGNNEVIPRPRARGKGQLSAHRIADRGSGGVDHDPWDLKIKRLRQRVRNLEIQHEIRQIQKRIREIELQQEMIRKETESGYIVRDDVNEEEEYPSFNSYYPVFFEEDTPRFDEDEEEFGYTSPPVFDSYEDDEVVSLGIYHVSPVFDESEDEEEVSLDSGDDALGVEVINRGNVNVDGVHVMGSESYGIQIQKMDILQLKVVGNSKLYGLARVEDVTINKDDLSIDEHAFKSAGPFGDMNFNKHVEIKTSGSIRNNKIVREASMEHGTIQKKPQLKKRRHDVPFDPGGCGYDPKLKLEDEFFRRGGE